MSKFEAQPFTSIKAAVAAIVKERCVATLGDEYCNAEGERVYMPYGNQIAVRFTRLPWSPSRLLLTWVIKLVLDRRDKNGYTILPIDDVHFDKDSKLVIVVADITRIDEMQPYPAPTSVN